MNASSSCHHQYPLFVSPVARRSNKFLWVDVDDDGNRGNGVLVRSVDVFDYHYNDINKEDSAASDAFWKNIARRPRDTKLKSLPAAYLHASLRVPNAIYYDNDVENPGVAVLVGSKYSGNSDTTSSSAVVDCTLYYPSDAGTMTRGVLEDPPTCIADRTKPVCVKDSANHQTCLTASNTSACGECQLPGNMTGWMLGKLVQNQRKGKRIYQPVDLNCWYDNTSMPELVAASNAMWQDRDLWFRFGKDSDSKFQGWTECTATLNIRDKSMLDAVVLTVGMPMSGGSTLCNHPTTNITLMQQRLQLAHSTGYGALPVLLYRETRGLQKVADCVRLWGGVNCDDGWQKEFFSQEYDFNDGACLRRPEKCTEVYYFPDCGNSKTASCSNYEILPHESKDTKKEMELLDVMDESTSNTRFDANSTIYKSFVNDQSRSCLHEHTPFISPIAKMTNNFLWSTEQEKSGVLIRSWDSFDQTSDKNSRPDQVSFLHASMQPPNAIYYESKREKDGVSLLIGTKYKRNSVKSDAAVDCLNYDPPDNIGTFSDNPPETYQGQTQCTATNNFRDKNVVDALVIPVGTPLLMGGPDLCHHPNATLIQGRLQHAFDSGYGFLPVLLYREIKGMSLVSDCEQMWGGIDCDKGWQKEFFSQEFTFGNGALLQRPIGCSEVYYFPDSARKDSFTCAESDSHEPSTHSPLLKNKSSEKAFGDLSFEYDSILQCMIVSILVVCLLRGIWKRHVNHSVSISASPGHFEFQSSAKTELFHHAFQGVVRSVRRRQPCTSSS